MVDKYYYYRALLITVVIISIVFGIKGCAEHEATQLTEKYKLMNPLEKCIDACPVGFVKDKECVQKCFDYVQLQTQAEQSSVS